MGTDSESSLTEDVVNEQNNQRAEQQLGEISKPESESTIEADSWADDFNEAMEDLGESLEELEEGMSVFKKKRLCTELCAGEDIDIPIMKTRCSLSCSEIYYY